MYGRSRHRPFQKSIILDLSAVFKLRYPSISNITSSVVIGNLESLGLIGSPNYFAPITLQAYSQRNYEYTKIPQALSSCSALLDPAINL
ncbi:hypothetical protein KSP40_PGU017288 [Platanthera guangdongensis]|uniref:DUF2921 domain-containing protein n=1 Tax=Platanthera guangdongensis TaxID=2320717 RepID=A0ABR2LDB6_9ASPA